MLVFFELGIVVCEGSEEGVDGRFFMSCFFGFWLLLICGVVGGCVECVCFNGVGGLFLLVLFEEFNIGLFLGFWFLGWDILGLVLFCWSCWRCLVRVFFLDSGWFWGGIVVGKEVVFLVCYILVYVFYRFGESVYNLLFWGVIKCNI